MSLECISGVLRSSHMLCIYLHVAFRLSSEDEIFLEKANLYFSNVGGQVIQVCLSLESRAFSFDSNFCDR